MTTTAAYFEIAFHPNPPLISTVRRFITSMHERRFGKEVAAQIGMTAHELLENATKYSTDGEATLRIDVGGTPEAPLITVTTRNKVRPPDVERVSSCLAELQRLGDPQIYYLDLMRRSRRITQSGGLGLGRIAAEGDMLLSMSHTADVLELQAVHRGAPT